MKKIKDRLLVVPIFIFSIFALVSCATIGSNGVEEDPDIRFMKHIEEVKIGDNENRVKELLGSPEKTYVDKYLGATVWKYRLGECCFDDNKTIKYVFSPVKPTCGYVLWKEEGFDKILKKKYKEDESLSQGEKNSLHGYIVLVLSDINAKGFDAFNKKDYEGALKVFSEVGSNENSDFDSWMVRPFTKAKAHLEWIRGDKSWIYPDRNILKDKIINALLHSDKVALVKLQSPVFYSSLFQSEGGAVLRGEFKAIENQSIIIDSILESDSTMAIVTKNWKSIDQYGVYIFFINKSITQDGTWEFNDLLVASKDSLSEVVDYVQQTYKMTLKKYETPLK
ncbi:MAG: hypothetical protein A2231_12835 [Candidatus Firestonebacteria bacterium RIFOXYA2_FULL_40_8]|nr:MAG: hypothetical protein A2231_12835 [Candidatus Firestonebacteria bacterium RIFOXYA2_FULL_40_8]